MKQMRKYFFVAASVAIEEIVCLKYRGYVMTKKHFKAIADIVSRCTQREGISPEMLVNELADYFRSINEHFDREKFLKVCRGQ